MLFSPAYSLLSAESLCVSTSLDGLAQFSSTVALADNAPRMAEKLAEQNCDLEMQQAPMYSATKSMNLNLSGQPPLAHLGP